MRRDDLELTRDCLFFKKAKDAFGPADVNLLLRAYAFARRKLKHNIASILKVAELLLGQGADSITLASALLAPTICRAHAGIHEIRLSFGEPIASILTEFKTPVSRRTDNELHWRSDIYSLLSSLAGDPRKVVLRLAFRLIELESSLETLSDEVYQVARETLDLYVPLASRFGLGDLRKRLEDVSFRILDPSTYEELRRRVDPIRAEDDKCLNLIMEGVTRLLKRKGIKGVVQGRTKSLYSIHCKMTRLKTDLHRIMDRIGIRIIVCTVPECYGVLGLLHSHYRPIPGTFDDYIGLPKDNGYQSLHTCVYPIRHVSHKPVEFQIRTELMHMEAEYGVAAHWRYKNSEATARDGQRQSQWLKSLIDQYKASENVGSFIASLHRQVCEDHLTVFGNAGQIVRLPQNATVKDYVKRFNSELRSHLLVKVNGGIASLDHRLQDGDTVEIIDGENPVVGVEVGEALE